MNTPLQTLELERRGAVVQVWLARPALRNALDAQMLTELTGTFRALAAEPELRAVVLSGRGPAFCAGADLGAMRAIAESSRDANLGDAQALADMLWALYECPLPVVARVHGDCVAGGIGLASVCDIRVAAEGARFALTEARLGLLPATVAPYVVRALGEQASRRYMLTAERFDAATAKALGLVHEVVPAERLDATVDELLAALLANGPQAVRACKQLVRDVAGVPITEALRADTARRIADARAGDEGREGVQAFLDKRKPAWRP